MKNRVYLLTVFVESLRRSMNISQQNLADIYEDSLNSEIEKLSSELCLHLEKITHSGESNITGPKLKALFRAKSLKLKIKLHEKLSNALDEVQQSTKYTLSKAEAERYIYSIRKLVKDVLEPDSAKAASSHGGTDRRTVNEKLKSHNKPEIYALKFILTRCLAPRMVAKSNISYVKEELLASELNIAKYLFSYSESSNGERFPLLELNCINSVIKTFLQTKRKIFSRDTREADRLKACNGLLEKVTEMLIDIGQLPISLFIGEEDEDDMKQYSIILASKAKDNLFVLLEEQDAKQAWNDITCLVYSITNKAITLTNEKIKVKKEIPLSKEAICEVVFFYLLYTSPPIIETLNRYQDSHNA